MTKSNTPALRFDGFDGEWETVPMGDVAEVNPSADIPNLFNYVDLASVLGTNLVNYRPYSKGKAPSRAQRVAQMGDIFYQTVRPYQKNNYHFNFKSDRAFVFSTGYAQIRPKIDSSYVFTAVQRDEFLTQVLDRCTGTSYPAIAPSQVGEITLSFPESWKEQRAIGELFSDLDALIEQRRAKHANLQQTKTALMQRMFPQDGADEPVLRLGGFSGAWESCKFGQLGVLSRGLTYSPRDLVDPYQGVRVYRSSNIRDHTVVTNSDDVWVRASAVNIPLLAKGDIIITASNGSVRLVGKSGLIRELPAPGAPGGFMLKCSSKTPGFIAALLQSPWFRSFLDVNVAGGNGAIGNLDSTQLSNESTLIPPALEEQRAIGEVFADLDALIAAESRYITQLTQVKTALLQRMFV